MLKRLFKILDKHTFTLLIIPDSGTGTRSVRVSLSRLRSIVVACLLIPLVTVFVAALLPNGFGSLVDPFGLARQNTLLRERVQALDNDLGQLRRRVAESSALEARLRVLSGLSPIDPEMRQMGVGGPQFTAKDHLAEANPAVAQKVDRVARSAEELLREAEFQRYSFLEIVESLEKQREEWASVPAIAPVPTGNVSSGFGRRLDPFTEKHSFHRGMDLSAERGSSIVATADGRVVFAGRDGDYGLTVNIDHGNGLETRYAHVLDLRVRSGQRVRRGQEIARVGSSGRSTAPHVHYEVRQNGRAVNPQSYVLPADEVVD